MNGVNSIFRIKGINMDKVDQLEEVIMNTFAEAADQGFEFDRVQAILNRTELSLKKQVNDFGWNIIMNLTHGWNHVSNPLTLLEINPILEKFQNDIQNESFLKDKVSSILQVLLTKMHIIMMRTYAKKIISLSFQKYSKSM